MPSSMSMPAAWEPLTCLTALTRLRLRDNRLDYVPRGLSAMRALAELDLGASEITLGGLFGAVPRGDSTLQPLAQLSALTGLSLQALGSTSRLLPAAPRHLTALTALQDLDLSRNALAQGKGAAPLQPLTALVRLTCLPLADCPYRQIPSDKLPSSAQFYSDPPQKKPKK